MGTKQQTDLQPLGRSGGPSERSPNRKWRIRGPRRALEIAGLKKLWLRLYRATGNVLLSCERVGRYPSTIEYWTSSDPEFKASREEIKDIWGSLLNSDFNALGAKALLMVETLLDDNLTNKELRFKISQWILKSQGVGVEKAVAVEHSGPGGGPIPVASVVVHLKGVKAIEAPEEVVEAEFEYVEDER